MKRKKKKTISLKPKKNYCWGTPHNQTFPSILNSFSCCLLHFNQKVTPCWHRTGHKLSCALQVFALEELDSLKWASYLRWKQWRLSDGQKSSVSSGKTYVQVHWFLKNNGKTYRSLCVKTNTFGHRNSQRFFTVICVYWYL